jgi:hypothetical protein
MGRASENYNHGLLNSSGSFAMLTAIRRAYEIFAMLVAQ